MLGYVCHETDMNIGAVLNPLFWYKRGQLWMQEQLIQNLLAAKMLNCDTQFSLLFKERLDASDQRPLTQAKRCSSCEANGFLLEARLICEPRTECASQVASKDMLSVEDLDPSALPVSIDDSAATVQGAKKFEQVGTDAWIKILAALLDGVDGSNRIEVVLLEFSPGVGNLYEVTCTNFWADMKGQICLMF